MHTHFFRRKANKPFKTIDQQIQILKNRNLTFLDEEIARNALRRYGYYEIINGYKDSFLSNSNSEERFDDGTTFEHIYALYQFDKTLSKDLLATLEKFERNFKQVLAYVVSENISVDQREYTNQNNLGTGRIYRRTNHNGNEYTVSDRDNLLKKFNTVINSENNPYKHYRDDHGNIPPWILIKGLTFGQAIYWYRLSHTNIRNQVLAKMFGQDINLLAIDQLKQLFGDILALYLKYRNLSAHDGRIYNYRSISHRLRNNSIIYNSNAINVSYADFNNGKYRSSIGIVVYTLALFENKTLVSELLKNIESNLRSYLSKYPDDKSSILNSLELEIIPNFEIEI